MISNTEFRKWIFYIVYERLHLEAYDIRRMTFYQAYIFGSQINHTPYYNMLVESKFRKLKDVLPLWYEMETLIIERTKKDATKLEMCLKPQTLRLIMSECFSIKRVPST